jgi:hypothetical protein
LLALTEASPHTFITLLLENVKFKQLTAIVPSESDTFRFSAFVLRSLPTQCNVCWSIISSYISDLHPSTTNWSSNVLSLLQLLDTLFEIASIEEKRSWKDTAVYNTNVGNIYEGA